MHALCPELLYWPSSPYGGDFADEYRFPVGNEHHWHQCTMHAEMERRITPEEYDKARSRFVTEYGYIGPLRLFQHRALLCGRADPAVRRGLGAAQQHL